MAEIDDIKKELELEKKKVSVLEQKLRLYEAPAPARAYYVGQKMLNQQVDYLDKFELQKEIGVNPKEDKIYDRAMDLFEKLTGNASKLNNLRIELSLSGDEKKDTSISKKPYTPESIADEVGELAGKRN
mgnify:CR=1 FL=1